MFDHLGDPMKTARVRAVSNTSSNNLFFRFLTRSRLVLAAQISDFVVIVTIAILIIR
jgi:hypothetical protein